MHDLVIRNGKIVDGTGKKAFMGDIAIDKDRISKVGLVEEQGKKEPIFIYDRGFNKGLSIIPISNHINKTGKNPLIGKQNNEIKFFDITEIYGFSKQSKIAVCFGQHKPVRIKKNMIATRFLCNHVIAAYCAGFKNIFAYVID
mgnify:CR=1 FL=1